MNKEQGIANVELARGWTS